MGLAIIDIILLSQLVHDFLVAFVSIYMISGRCLNYIAQFSRLIRTELSHHSGILVFIIEHIRRFISLRSLHSWWRFINWGGNDATYFFCIIASSPLFRSQRSAIFSNAASTAWYILGPSASTRLGASERRRIWVQSKRTVIIIHEGLRRIWTFWDCRTLAHYWSGNFKSIIAAIYHFVSLWWVMCIHSKDFLPFIRKLVFDIMGLLLCSHLKTALKSFTVASCVNVNVGTFYCFKHVLNLTVLLWSLIHLVHGRPFGSIYVCSHQIYLSHCSNRGIHTSSVSVRRVSKTSRWAKHLMVHLPFVQII